MIVSPAALNVPARHSSAYGTNPTRCLDIPPLRFAWI